jgi:hypothetical protein
MGCIWQLLRMGEKAAKLPNYCILHWRLNALKNKVGAVYTDRHGRGKGEILSPPLFSLNHSLVYIFLQG